MRRIFVLSILPMMIFALEKVNLIKDGGFEKDNGVWCAYGGGLSTDSVIANRHDAEKFFAGSYSGSCDTRIAGQHIVHGDSAVLIQGFPVFKSVTDIDSLLLAFSVMPKDTLFTRAMSVRIGLYIDAQSPNYQLACYCVKASDLSVSPPSHVVFLNISDFPLDNNWHSFVKGIKADLLGHGISTDSKIDSFFVLGWGGYLTTYWRGQKIYFDDIRLTGYADYDVGVKGILSRDSIGNAYTPTARIKNFGRKPADSFLVIATIEGGSGVVYADTLSWSLAADTEDTVSFKEFKPSDAANYTLTVSTVMTPDESDEDDVMSRTLFGTAVAEPVLSPQSLNLQIEGVLRAPSSLRVSYTLPLGEQGTISLYDPSGRRIESFRVQGEGSVSLKSNLSSGVYFVKLDSGKTSITRKAVILH